jgi:gliding motility-associated-like protein
MPNAFSPNDDGNNDKYGAKGVNDENATGRWKSIIDFHAYIFNRWGQKLYEWHDVNGYWDGTFNGSPVKDGVYFVVVKAKGADGMEYNIRKDVNVIRNFNPETNGGENHE